MFVSPLIILPNILNFTPLINYFTHLLTLVALYLIFQSRIVRKVINITLALLLLISTVGVTVDNHYCHGHYIGTWFYVQEDACDMEMPMDSDWCHDDITVYSIQNEFQSVPATASPELSLVDITSFVSKPIINVIADNTTQKIGWVKINPPPSEPNIYTKVQSFLL